MAPRPVVLGESNASSGFHRQRTNVGFKGKGPKMREQKRFREGNKEKNIKYHTFSSHLLIFFVMVKHQEQYVEHKGLI